MSFQNLQGSNTKPQFSNQIVKLNEIKYNDIKFLADVIGIQKSRSLNNN